jgi:four helix bundle protein
MKEYDLEDRTLNFAQRVKVVVNSLPKSISNIEYGKQLIRSAGSVGANYREANEALSKKDFLLRIRISKKEAKESHYWLELIECQNEEERKSLIQESTELMKIFGAIIEKTKDKK